MYLSTCRLYINILVNICTSQQKAVIADTSECRDVYPTWNQGSVQNKVWMVDYHVSSSTSSGVGRDCEIAGEPQHFCSGGYFIRAIHIQAGMNVMFSVQEINTPVCLKKRSKVIQEHGRVTTFTFRRTMRGTIISVKSAWWCHFSLLREVEEHDLYGFFVN